MRQKKRVSRNVFPGGSVVIPRVSRVIARVIARVIYLETAASLVKVFLTSRDVMGRTNIVLNRQTDRQTYLT